MVSLSYYRKAYTTYILIIINVLIFILARAEGGFAAERIYRKGALLVPINSSYAEWWWRPLTANFLHKTGAHLILNMFALFIFGPFLEVILGVKRYIFCYLLSGIGAMLLLVLISLVLGVDSPQLIAGASGCIFGVIGARAAIFLRAWRTENNASARSHFIFMMLVALFQVVFDLFIFNFNISLNLGSHVNGMVIGFLTAGFLRHASFAWPAASLSGPVDSSE